MNIQVYQRVYQMVLSVGKMRNYVADSMMINPSTNLFGSYFQRNSDAQV